MHGTPEDDVVFFEDLALRILLGINPDEREKAQDILVSVRLGASVAPAVASGQLEDAVDYRALKKRMMAVAEERHFGLVEELAHALCSLALDVPRVRWAWVRVEKPGALRHARTVGVEIVRHRAQGA